MKPSVTFRVFWYLSLSIIISKMRDIKRSCSESLLDRQPVGEGMLTQAESHIKRQKMKRGAIRALPSVRGNKSRRFVFST